MEKIEEMFKQINSNMKKMDEKMELLFMEITEMKKDNNQMKEQIMNQSKKNRSVRKRNYKEKLNCKRNRR